MIKSIIAFCRDWHIIILLQLAGVAESLGWLTHKQLIWVDFSLFGVALIRLVRNYLPKRVLFLKTRLRGVWLLFTKRHIVVLGSNNHGDISCRYNVTHASFRLMVRAIDPAYEANEGGQQALSDARDILSRPTR